MASNFTVFESAVSALSVNSQALSVASQNIANVNTTGYSRQYVVMKSRTPQTTGGHELGRGVEVADIRRVYDNFAEIRLRDAQESKARYEATSGVLKQVESYFNEVGGNGLAKYTSDLFNSFHEVGTDPANTNPRLDLLNKADIMIDRFNDLATKLEQAKTLIDGDIINSVNDINNLAQEIAELNLKVQSSGEGADLTFRDQRNAKINELAQYIDISVVETSDNVLQIYAGDGIQLVNGVNYGQFDTEPNVSNNNHLDLLYVYGGVESNISTRINGGSLYGLTEVRDTLITNYQNQLDEMAGRIIVEVNDLHSNGYNLTGSNLVEFFDEDALATDTAAGTTLLTDLKDSNGAHLRIKAGDTITVTGTVTGAMNSTITVASGTTLTSLAASLQAIIRAAGDNTETVTVLGDGSLEVTAGGVAVTNLQLTITGKTAFNTAFDYPTPIAIAGTGASDTLTVTDFTGASSLIALDSAVDGTPNGIAASGSSDDLPGGNSIAVQLAALQNGLVSFDSGDTTFAGFYGNILATIGSDSRSYANRAEFSAQVSRQAQLQREQISGVSLEEEQLNLIKYQSAFQAASRLISVASEILQRLVELGQ